MTTLKYLFTYDGAAADLNTIDTTGSAAGLYRIGNYPTEDTPPMFDLDIGYDEINIGTQGSLNPTPGRGNRYASNIPFGPIALPNALPFYWMLGSYDLSANTIQIPSYGTAKVNFDLYSAETYSGTTEEKYLLDCYMKDLAAEYTPNAGWEVSGSITGGSHGDYAGVTAVDNGLPETAGGTDITDNFDTLESVVWDSGGDAHSITQIERMGLQFKQMVKGHPSSTDLGVYGSHFTNASIFKYITLQTLGFSTNLKTEYDSGTKKDMTFTMGKSTSDHALAFTLTDCYIVARRKHREPSTPIHAEYAIIYAGATIVESGTNLPEETVFYPTSVA